MLNWRHPSLCARMGRVRLGVLDTISGDSAGLPRSAPDEFQKSRFDRQAADFSLLDHPCLNILHLSCLNSRHLSCLSSRHLSCPNSRHLSCLSRRHLSRLNYTLFVCQKHAKGPTHVIATDLDNRTVIFLNRPHPPKTESRCGSNGHCRLASY